MASVILKCGQVDLSKASENVSDLQLIFKFRIFRKIGKICQFSQICAGVSTSTSSFRGLNSSFKQSISSQPVKAWPWPSDDNDDEDDFTGRQFGKILRKLKSCQLGENCWSCNFNLSFMI